ncbi:MAG TPA: DUF5132 domain-containing protein [Stellaceae bacterium]|nr:DUF5132 domain-containing protein [Stellaceae bacterium]
MPKFNARVAVGEKANGSHKAPAESGAPQTGEPGEPETGDDAPDVVTTVTTIGVIGVAAALIDVALIPGMIVGVAAAFAPKYMSNIGERLQPLFNYTVRGAYKMTRSARHAVAEAQERMHDLAAEVEAEEAAAADAAASAHASS